MNNSKNNREDGVSMITHDASERITQGWHLDKRISVAHFFATFAFAAGLAGTIYGISSDIKERITTVEQDQSKHQALAALEFTGIQAQLEASKARDKEMLGEWLRQNQEILHRLDRMEDSTKLSLDRIEDGVNRHIEASGQGHSRPNG